MLLLLPPFLVLLWVQVPLLFLEHLEVLAIQLLLPFLEVLPVLEVLHFLFLPSLLSDLLLHQIQGVLSVQSILSHQQDLVVQEVH